MENAISVDVGNQALDIQSGGGFTCALLVTHQLICWGNNVVATLFIT